MADLSLCAKLFNGLDVSCDVPQRKYYQQACIINKDDIDVVVITLPDSEGKLCEYKATMSLKVGTTGYKFLGPEKGSSFKGFVSKSTSDLGYPQYNHQTQILVSGVDKETKCILDSLDKGSFVVAMQLKDGTVELYGLGNGLTTGDYDYDIQEGGGGTAIILSSLEDAPEGYLPLIYESAIPGSENADFDVCFENIP